MKVIKEEIEEDMFFGTKTIYQIVKYTIDEFVLKKYGKNAKFIKKIEKHGDQYRCFFDIEKFPVGFRSKANNHWDQAHNYKIVYEAELTEKKETPLKYAL